MKKIQTITSLGVLLALLAILIGPPLQVANAAAITSASDTMSSSKAVTASSHKIKFTTPTGAGDSTDTIIITFPSTGTTPFNFTSKTISTVTFTHGATTGLENTETLAATPSVTAWGAVFSGTQNRILTLTAPTDGIGAAVVAASDKIILTYDNTNSINPSSNASPYTIAISGTFNDSGNIPVAILDDDQVAVSGTVSETISFSLGATSVALGTLSSTAATSSSHTVTLATNAASGMVLTFSGTTLTSGANTITAMSTAAPSSVGTEQFGINAKDNVTPNVGAECSGTTPIAAAATGYATIDNFKFVSGETILSSSAGINSTSCTISYIANIAGATEAGSYTTTLTYTATSTF
jgi:hypothetical protein